MDDADTTTDALLRRLPRGDDDGGADLPDDPHPDEAVWRSWRDGGLPPATQAALDAHLARCAPCRAFVRVWARGVAGDRVAAITVASLAALPRARSRWRAPLIAGGLAAAAAVTFALVRPSPQTPLPPVAYEFAALSGPQQAVRGATESGDLVLPEAELAVTLRPVSPLSGPAPLMVAFAAQGDEPPRPLPAAALRWASDGSVTLGGRADALLGPAPESPRALVLMFVFATTPEALRAIEAEPSRSAPADGVRIERLHLRYGRRPEGQ